MSRPDFKLLTGFKTDYKSTKQLDGSNKILMEQKFTEYIEAKFLCDGKCGISGVMQTKLSNVLKILKSLQKSFVTS